MGRAEARYSARDGGGGCGVFGGKNKFSQRNKDDTLFMHLYEEFFLDHLHSVAGLARISVEHTQPVSSSSVIVIVILQCNRIVTVVITTYPSIY